VHDLFDLIPGYRSGIPHSELQRQQQQARQQYLEMQQQQEQCFGDIEHGSEIRHRNCPQAQDFFRD